MNGRTLIKEDEDDVLRAFLCTKRTQRKKERRESHKKTKRDEREESDRRDRVRREGLFAFVFVREDLGETFVEGVHVVVFGFMDKEKGDHETNKGDETTDDQSGADSKVFEDGAHGESTNERTDFAERGRETVAS